MGTAWNKGFKTGKLSLEHRRKIQLALKLAYKTGKRTSTFKKGQFVNESTWNWKGNDVSYIALHSWVRRKLGNPIECKRCKKPKNRYEWANISRSYKRELTDWISLCTSCHQYCDYHKIDLSDYLVATTT